MKADRDLLLRGRRHFFERFSRKCVVTGALRQAVSGVGVRKDEQPVGQAAGAEMAAMTMGIL